jgi:hypothetical protein
LASCATPAHRNAAARGAVTDSTRRWPATRQELDATPKPGDVSVCISCVQILVFTDELTLRAPMPGEIEPTPALRRAQAAVRALDRRNMQ